MVRASQVDKPENWELHGTDLCTCGYTVYPDGTFAQDEVANNCQDVVVDYRNGLLYGDSFFSISLNYNLHASTEEVAAADAKLVLDSMNDLYMYTEWGNFYDAIEIASTKMCKLDPIAD